MRFQVSRTALLCGALIGIMLAQGTQPEGSFELKISAVRSISPERRVGFSKSLPTYAVDATTEGRSFVLYCVKNAPEVGRSYVAVDRPVPSNYSWLHLWPVDSAAGKKKKRLYRVVIIRDAIPGEHPDVACDVYSETKN